MIQQCDSIFYNTLDELQATYKSNHPDVLRMKEKYGTDVEFSRIMHREGVVPRFELSCFKVKKEEK